jgi:hypothetical protein
MSWLHAIAITGDVNEIGEVRAVDEESLQCKVRALMYSWIEYLVVPKEQQEATERIVAEHRVYYPGKNIKIIGVDYLREIFFDRRLSNYKTTGWPAYIGRRILRKKKRVFENVRVLGTADDYPKTPVWSDR